MSDWWDLLVVCYVLLNGHLGSNWKKLNAIRKIKNGTKDDGSRISHEIVRELLLKLPSKTISNFWTSTKGWKSLMDDNEFWKAMCEKEHFYEQTRNLKSKFYLKLLKKYTYPEEALYIYNQTIRDNWNNNNFKIINVSYHIHQIHYFDDEEIIATSCTDLFILNSSTGTIKHNLPIPSSPLIKVAKNEDFLVTYLGDSNFLVFDRKNQTSCNACVSSASNIKEDSLNIYGNRIFFLTSSGNFNIVNIKSCDIEYEHADVTCASVHKNVIILGTTKDGTHTLDLNYNSLRVIQNCCKGKTTFKMEFVEEYLIVLCGGTKNDGCNICVWDIQTETKLTSITEMCSSSVTLLDNNKIACQKNGEAETEIFEVWNFLTGNLLFVIDDSGNRPITCITSNHHFIFTIFTNSNTKYLKMWCPKTGNFMKFLKFESEFLCDNFCKPTDTKFAYLRRSPNCLSKSLCILDYDNEGRKERRTNGLLLL